VLHALGGGDGNIQHTTNESGGWVSEPVTSSQEKYFTGNSFELGSGGFAHFAVQDQSASSDQSTLAVYQETDNAWVRTEITQYYGARRGPMRFELDGMGRWHFVYVSKPYASADDNDLYYGRYDPADGSWTQSAVADTYDHTFTVRAFEVEPSGAAHVLYAARESFDRTLHYGTNESGSFVTEQLESESVGYGWIGVDSSSAVHAIYGNSGDMKYAARASDGTWTKESFDIETRFDAVVTAADTVFVAEAGDQGIVLHERTGGSWSVVDTIPEVNPRVKSLVEDGTGSVHVLYRGGGGTSGGLPWRGMDRIAHGP
jgi:hypothetical protein